MGPGTDLGTYFRIDSFKRTLKMKAEKPSRQARDRVSTYNIFGSWVCCSCMGWGDREDLRQMSNMVYKKKTVHSSHLALRFYKGCGWTKKILQKYVLEGRVIDQIGDQPTRDYWWFDHRSKPIVDFDALYENEVSEVVPFPGYSENANGADYFRYISPEFDKDLNLK